MQTQKEATHDRTKKRRKMRGRVLVSYGLGVERAMTYQFGPLHLIAKTFGLDTKFIRYKECLKR